MTFASLDFVMQRCEEHLDNTNMRSTEIESYFVQYLLVRICAEYETRVTTLVHRRCSRTTDPHLKSFAQQTATYVCQRFSIGDIAKVLGRFGVDYKQAFHGQVMSGMAHVAWDNIYTNRQAVAHKTGTQMSLGDLKKDYGDSLVVLVPLCCADRIFADHSLSKLILFGQGSLSRVLTEYKPPLSPRKKPSGQRLCFLSSVEPDKNV